MTTTTAPVRFATVVVVARKLQDSLRVKHAEWICTAALVWWAFILTWNETLFATSGSHDKLADLAPQWLWAGFLSLIGIFRLTVLVINGTWNHSAHWRGVTAFLSCLPWALIAIGFAPNLSTGVGLYTILLYGDFRNGLRAMAEAGAEDARRAKGA